MQLRRKFFVPSFVDRACTHDLRARLRSCLPTCLRLRPRPRLCSLCFLSRILALDSSAESSESCVSRLRPPCARRLRLPCARASSRARARGWLTCPAPAPVAVHPGPRLRPQLGVLSRACARGWSTCPAPAPSTRLFLSRIEVFDPYI